MLLLSLPAKITSYTHSTYGTRSPFPPSFEGNPWSYAFGLFGDTLAASLCLAILLSFLFEKRRRRQVNRRINNWTDEPPVPAWSPLWLYRWGMIWFLTFVVMRTLPDAVWMLAWGEVSLPTIELLLRLDMICAGLSIVPLFAATVCWAMGRQVIPHKLLADLSGRSVTGGRPAWDVVVKNIRIVLVVSFIALAVMVGKASG